jgi:hypothetical protein
VSLIFGTGVFEAGAAAAGGYAGEANAAGAGSPSIEVDASESGRREEAAKAQMESWDDAAVKLAAEVREKSTAAFSFTCGAAEISSVAQAGPEAANKNNATQKSFFILTSWRIEAQSRDKAFLLQ